MGTLIATQTQVSKEGLPNGHDQWITEYNIHLTNESASSQTGFEVSLHDSDPQMLRIDSETPVSRLEPDQSYLCLVTTLN